MIRPTDKEIKRWYPLIDHPIQLSLITEAIRFKLAPCGRRSGKTERAKRYMADCCIEHSDEKYFIAAPTFNQVKKMYWSDMKLLTMSSLHDKKPSETDLIIYMPNGTELHLIGLDKPERFEGIAWSGGVIDEIADIKPEAWEANIRPALDTYNPTRPDYKPWCWLIGVPDGLNHYYDLCQYAETANDPEWKVYHWKSDEILPIEVIASAKRQMSVKQFRQEYEGSFENASGRICEDYSKDNYCDESIKEHEEILYYCDFNYTPMSHGIGVERIIKSNITGDQVKAIFLIDEVVLESAIAEQNAMEFCEKYKDHKNKRIKLFGDPSGKNGEKHGHESDYLNMEKVFRSNGWYVQRCVARAHPAIKDRQNAVRAMIKTAEGEIKLFVNPKTAEWNHKALATVQTKVGSSFLEDESNKYQHMFTAIGYMINYMYPIRQGMTSVRIKTFGNRY